MSELVQFPRTTGTMKPPRPVTCEWCRAAGAAHTVELTKGHVVKRGYKAPRTIRVCSACLKIIERNVAHD